MNKGDNTINLQKVNKALACIVNNSFITHISKSNWGSYVLIMTALGEAFIRVYWFNDDSKTIYTDMLSVLPEFRKQRLATNLLNIFEQISLTLGANTCCLWVIENTWVHDWYLRKGYEDFKKHEIEEHGMWMRKKLILNG